MNSKRDLFKRKPDPWAMLIRELREASPYIMFYVIIGGAFLVAMIICLWCQAPISHGHTVGLI